MKTEIEQLVDRLAKEKKKLQKSLDLSTCNVERGYCCVHDEVAIFLGDMIEKLRAQEDEKPESKSWERPNMLLKAWEPCGLPNSLQSILASTEWVEDYEECEDHGGLCHCKDVDTSYPKDNSIRNLLQLLLQLGL